MPTILVTGGAGYIGCFAVRSLREAGHRVVVLDNLSEGHREAAGDAELVEGDLLDPPGLAALFARNAFDAVFHLAAVCLVPESIADPEKYRRNNVTGTANLVTAMRDAACRRLVFSSTAAVYGEPLSSPIAETAPTIPVNPYGETKAAAEALLAEAARAWGLRSVTFRYFNAAGADLALGLGEDHDPETHLIPLAVRAALGGPPLSVFGDDYATPDGTAIRDYVHVRDIARAHVLGFEHLMAEGPDLTLNLGTGKGNSVREVIGEVEKTSGRKVPVRSAPRRPGDPTALVADGSLAKKKLGFSPEASLTEIVASAVAWTKARPEGYGGG